MNRALPAPLKRLVSQTEALLGEVVLKAGGSGVYRPVEAMRRRMKDIRDSSAKSKPGRLSAAFKAALSLPPGRRADFARAYTLYLELVNVCENAYRTHRLKARFASSAQSNKARVTYVLTSHPTESRSPTNIALLTRIQTHLIKTLGNGRPPNPAVLKSLLQICWRTGSHSRRKPGVEDEAAHIYSLLSNVILDELLALNRDGHEVRLRTWVGGDKDGHPGVGPRQMTASLALARTRLAAYMRDALLLPALEELSLLDAQRWLAPLDQALRSLDAAVSLRPGDGRRVKKLRADLSKTESFYRTKLGAVPRGISRALELLALFPGLVVPLELREEAGSFLPGSPIDRMVKQLDSIAKGGDVSWYARGCVISMASKAEDILTAMSLVRRASAQPLPIIPLFETGPDLAGSRKTLDDCWKHPDFRRAVRRDAHLEVMLGYSDTAKRMGALPSRLAIHEAMKTLNRWARRKKIRLQFFHGSGGSEGRGGGTIEEQAAGWPSDALARIKLTLQGEMAQRNLATPEILRSQIHHIASVQADPPAHEGPGRLSRELGERARREFESMAQSESLRLLLNSTTPYPRLKVLNIGSRPSKRKKKNAGLESLRAIPWILCWTQTRLLLPVWYGIGTAWREISKKPGSRGRLRAAVRRDPFLRSYLRLLGFALAKGEPLIWDEYARRLAPPHAGDMIRRIERERKAAMDLIWAAAPGQGPLWDRAWLKESIYYRAPMIHPLNLIQIGLLSKKRWNKADETVFRETVTGIAAGMLTTG